MADLSSDFDKEQDLSKSFDQEADLHKAFDSESEVKPPAQPTEEEFPTGEFLRRELLEGGTAGFSEELAGLGAAGIQAATGDYGPTKGRSWQDIVNAYQQMKSQEEARRKSIEEKAPFGATTATQMVGAIPNIAITGPLGAVRQGAVLGAASALGASETPLTGPEASPIKTAEEVAVGAGLGALGGKLAGSLAEKTTPEALETAASKAASKAVGLKPSKELTSIYDSETGKIIQGSDIIKGIGKTAMEEGALPMTGGPSAIYDKALEAIDTNKAKLTPIFESTQKELDPNLLNILQDTGNIEGKVNSFLSNYLDTIPYSSKTPGLAKTLRSTADDYLQRLSQADGNLSALNGIKLELQNAATDLSKNVYQEGSNASYEADMLKRLGGIVRQHIEDLANYASEDSGNQIHQINSTLQNLYTYKDAAKKLMDKGDTGSMVSKILNIPAKILTDNSVDKLAKMATAKTTNLASKAVSTPAGDLVQKAVVNVPLATVTNPFTLGRIQQRYSPSDASELATNLYNSTDDSLKQVAGKLTTTPGLEFYGKNLNEAIDTGDEFKKGQAIFLILQNPTSRKLVTPDNKLITQEKQSLQKSLNR